MSAPPAPPPAPPRPSARPSVIVTDQRWSSAEAAIVRRLAALDRWEAERWAAGHERRLSPLAAVGLRVAAMQVAIERGKDVYLDVAFDRLATAGAAAGWIDDHCGGRCADPDHRDATEETFDAVIEVAEQALLAVVLADEATTGALRPERAALLDRAARTVLGPEAAADRTGDDGPN